LNIPKGRLEAEKQRKSKGKKGEKINNDLHKTTQYTKGTTIYLERGGGGLWFFSKKNIQIPNDAEKNILILVEEKKI
jgi:hypothetical protein